MNNPFVYRRAAALAERVRRLAGEDQKRRIDTAFELTLCRQPSGEERSAAAEYLVAACEPGDQAALDQRLVEFCHALVNLGEFMYAE